MWFRQTAQREALSADAIGECAGLAGFRAIIRRDGHAEAGQPHGPEIGVVLLRQGETAQNAAAMRLGLLLRERVVGMKTTHFRLPVARERFDQTICVLAVHLCLPVCLRSSNDRSSASRVSVFRVTGLGWAGTPPPH